MKKLCILAVGALFAISTVLNAQAPASKLDKKEVNKETKNMHHGKKDPKNCPQGKPQQKCCDPKQCKNGKPCGNKKGCDPKQCKGGKPCPKDKEKGAPSGK